MATVRYTLDLNEPQKLSEETKRRFAAMTEDEIEAMAGDPDEGIEPLTDEMLLRGVVGRLIRQTREALGLTQEAFAERFRLPYPDSSRWEAGAVMPDAAVVAYLEVIARETAAVDRALAAA